MKKTVFAIMALCAMTTSVLQAQDEFMPEFHAHSSKKISYITMDNGDELEVNLKRFKFQKGQIDELKYETMNDVKVKVDVSKIKHMYVPASDLGKLAAGMSGLSHMKNWGDKELSSDLFSKGYYYFEKAPTRVKKKSFDTMNQLLNPHTSKEIRVYPDYRAKETMSIGIAGIKAVGGLAKSYYIRIGDAVAYKIQKKDYRDQFKLIYKGCPEMVAKYKDRIKWSEFATHVRVYTEMCAGE